MSDEKNSNSPQADQLGPSRREFLKTAGKTAVYTPPAMLAVSHPSFATAQSSGGQAYPTPDQVRQQIGDEYFDSVWQQFLDWLANNNP